MTAERCWSHPQHWDKAHQQAHTATGPRIKLLVADFLIFPGRNRTHDLRSCLLTGFVTLRCTRYPPAWRIPPASTVTSQTLVFPSHPSASIPAWSRRELLGSRVDTAYGIHAQLGAALQRSSYLQYNHTYTQSVIPTLQPHIYTICHTYTTPTHIYNLSYIQYTHTHTQSVISTIQPHIYTICHIYNTTTHIHNLSYIQYNHTYTQSVISILQPHIYTICHTHLHYNHTYTQPVIPKLHPHIYNLSYVHYNHTYTICHTYTTTRMILICISRIIPKVGNIFSFHS